jgi:ubiquitin thioesterase protein OTUB1
MGNKQKFASEEQRLKSLATLLKDTGLPEHVYEDFLDDTLELLQETGNSTDGGAGLLQVFNDFGRSMSIITYFKVSSHTDTQFQSLLTIS